MPTVSPGISSLTKNIDEITVAVAEVRATCDYFVDLKLRIKNDLVVRDYVEANCAALVALKNLQDLLRAG